MKVVHVIPIARGMGKEILTYFSAADISQGALVTVPLRKNEVNALVVSSEDAALSKANIKDARYGMKKVSGVATGSFFTPAFLRAAESAARYHASGTGAVIDSLVPRAVLDNYARFPSPAKPGTDAPAAENAAEAEKKAAKKKEAAQLRVPAPVAHEKFLLQENESDRLASYKSVIRESFARKRSVFLCVPTVQDIHRVAYVLSRGIEEYTIVLNGELTKKNLLAAWQAALAETHPVLIVATGSFLSLPRTDIGTFVVERENAAAYKKEHRPFLDVRVFAEFLVRETGGKLIFGDILLRTETLYRKEKGEFLEFAPLKYRSLSAAEGTIIDMAHCGKDAKRQKFTLLSDELLRRIRCARENNERFFLLSSRRGLYPLTVCGDCGKTVTCTACHAPLVVHIRKKQTEGGQKNATASNAEAVAKNVFLCHICGRREESSDRCERCESWRLATLGIGSERVEEELKTLLPEATIVRIDKDTAPTRKRALALAEKFYASPGAILVGTEMALRYLPREITNAAVVSLDSLFTLPDFRMNERIFALLLAQRAKASRRFIVQTRMEDRKLFDFAVRGNLLDFYREEIDARKQFRYPPFTVLVKLTVAAGTRRRAASEAENVEAFLSDYNPVSYPAFISKQKGRYIMHILVRVERSLWPDKTLLGRLLALPPSVSVNVGAESLL